MKKWTPEIIAGFLLIVGASMIFYVAGSSSGSVSVANSNRLFAENSSDNLVFFGIILAFLAYVAVEEGKTRDAWKSHVRHSTDGRAKFIIVYSALVAGDFALIVLAMLTLHITMPLTDVDWGCPLIATIRCATWFHFVFFTCEHLRNWLRGWELFVPKDQGKESGLCRGRYYVCERNRKFYLIACGTHTSKNYSVAWEFNPALSLRYKSGSVTDGRFCAIYELPASTGTIRIKDMWGTHKLDLDDLRMIPPHDLAYANETFVSMQL